MSYLEEHDQTVLKDRIILRSPVTRKLSAIQGIFSLDRLHENRGAKIVQDFESSLEMRDAGSELEGLKADMTRGVFLFK